MWSYVRTWLTPYLTKFCSCPYLLYSIHIFYSEHLNVIHVLMFIGKITLSWKDEIEYDRRGGTLCVRLLILVHPRLRQKFALRIRCSSISVENFCQFFTYWNEWPIGLATMYWAYAWSSALLCCIFIIFKQWGFIVSNLIFQDFNNWTISMQSTPCIV